MNISYSLSDKSKLGRPHKKIDDKKNINVRSTAHGVSLTILHIHTPSFPCLAISYNQNITNNTKWPPKFVIQKGCNLGWFIVFSLTLTLFPRKYTPWKEDHFKGCEFRLICEVSFWNNNTSPFHLFRLIIQCYQFTLLVVSLLPLTLLFDTNTSFAHNHCLAFSKPCSSNITLLCFTHCTALYISPQNYIQPKLSVACCLSSWICIPLTKYGFMMHQYSYLMG